VVKFERAVRLTTLERRPAFCIRLVAGRPEFIVGLRGCLLCHIEQAVMLQFGMFIFGTFQIRPFKRKVTETATTPLLRQLNRLL
jgi:hypothetical protein